MTPDDIKRIALPALRHRVALAPDALLEGRTRQRSADARCIETRRGAARLRRRLREAACACRLIPGRTRWSALAARCRGGARRAAGAACRSAVAPLAAAVRSRRCWRRGRGDYSGVTRAPGARAPPTHDAAPAAGVRDRRERPRASDDRAATGTRRWRCELLRPRRSEPARPKGCRSRLTLAGGTAHRTAYTVIADAARRSDVRAGRRARPLALGAAASCSSGSATHETRRVYPDFAQVARYAWLAGDRRLQEIGIKTYQQRGEGTDFKQLVRIPHRRSGAPHRLAGDAAARASRSSASSRTSATSA